MLLLAAACAPSDPPARNPAGETGTPGAADPTGTVAPLPTFTPTTTPDTTATPEPTPTAPIDLNAEAERVAGEAISRLAGWVGAPETEFHLIDIEAVDWPNACLGVEIPTLACAEVITPGWRVRIGHVNAPTRPYFVHASRDGRYRWAPSYEPYSERTIASVDPDAGVVMLEPIDGNEDLIGTEHRVAPGSYLEAPLTALQPGQRVALNVTYGVLTAEGDSSLIVWLVPLAE